MVVEYIILINLVYYNNLLINESKVFYFNRIYICFFIEERFVIERVF